LGELWTWLSEGDEEGPDESLFGAAETAVHLDKRDWIIVLALSWDLVE
jgi:hypothetical protein